jgi:hypothetical protein
VAKVGTLPGEHLHPPTPNSPAPAPQLSARNSSARRGRGDGSEEVAMMCWELGRGQRGARVSICPEEPSKQTQTHIPFTFVHFTQHWRRLYARPKSGHLGWRRTGRRRGHLIREQTQNRHSFCSNIYSTLNAYCVLTIVLDISIEEESEPHLSPQ